MISRETEELQECHQRYRGHLENRWIRQIMERSGAHDGQGSSHQWNAIGYIHQGEDHAARNWLLQFLDLVLHYFNISSRCRIGEEYNR